MEENVFLRKYFKTIHCFYQIKKCIRYFSGTTQIDLQKFNGMSEENIETKNKSNSNLNNKFC